MDDDGANTDDASQAARVNPRDGLIDFAAYSIEQLRELQYSIDPEVFPENFKRLVAALKRKEEPVAQPPPQSDAVVGRFTSHDGLLGWFEAKFGRSPVYGIGSIEVGESEIILTGWQRTWLGVPVETQVTREVDDVRNVVQDNTCIRFEIKRKYRPAARILFQPGSSEHVSRLLDNFPKFQTVGFFERWSSIRDFNQKLRAVSGRPSVTPTIVGLNVAVFASMAVATRKLGQFTPQELLNWGANFGPLTVNGQWWRLFTALFVHSNLLHLLVNMWALWNVGRLSERLFGRGTLLFLYVFAGVLASLTSIAWDPSQSSVGASGAIFGLFGAFLAFLSRQRHQIPPTILRKHSISTAAFVLFNLVSGAIQPGIDNAAHVGGLLSGFVLGFTLARPLDPEIRKPFPVTQSLAAVAIIATVIFAAIWQVKGIGSELTVPEQFLRRHNAYATGEAQNLQLWNTLAQRASTGSMSAAELGQRFEEDILPFWQAQKDQLEQENETLEGPERTYAQLVAEFTNLRYQWASAVIDATKNNESSRMADAQNLAEKTGAVNARLERIGIRSRMDHRPRALSAHPFFMRIRELFTGYRWNCVNAPASVDTPISDSDAHSDGPAMRHALGCRAQQLFMAGDYQRLETLMTQYMGSLEDLPDGSSRYEGLVGGLADLFRFGGLTPDIAFGHTADWRRMVKASTMADLVEAMLFSEWAWSARGTGFANSISAQNLAVYGYRTQMAVAALDEVADRASNNPIWYTLSLDVGLDQSKDKAQLRAIFDQGFAKAPKYRPLYRRMLRILMPRWGGSYEDVDKFIKQIDARSAKDEEYERYAELYSAYARMEGDDLDLFTDTPAFWSGMRTGYIGLLRRYPMSDSVLNSFANFSCRAGDKDTYGRLKGSVSQRLSSTAWTVKYSVASCDKKLGVTGGYTSSFTPEALPGERIHSLGGVRLGMTRMELLATKGRPIRQEEKYWVYNSIDSKHNGVLAATFSSSAQGSEGVVQAIEYTGDTESAPNELPCLNGWSTMKVVEKYGPQIEEIHPRTGETEVTFPNGVYITSHEDKVYRYGIFTVR